MVKIEQFWRNSETDSSILKTTCQIIWITKTELQINGENSITNNLN